MTLKAKRSNISPVRKVDERLHGARLHPSLHVNDLLLALGHVVGEHGVEVGDGGSQDDAVGVVQVVTDLQEKYCLSQQKFEKLKIMPRMGH